MSKFKTFDFKNCNFETIEDGVDYFISFLENHNYVEFCEEFNPNSPVIYAYRIAVKKLADDVFIISDGMMNFNFGEELHFQDSFLCRSLQSVKECVLKRIKKDYDENSCNAVADYFHDRYAYVSWE